MFLSKIFLKYSKGVIFLYDITKEKSLDDTIYCYNYMKDYIPNDAIIALVGNKIDLFEYGEITREKGEKIANEYNFLFDEVSAKDGANVNEFFNTLIQRIYERQHNIEDESKTLNENNIKLNNNREGKKGCLK